MPIFNVDVTADPHRPRVVGPDHAPVPAINDFLSYLEQRVRPIPSVRMRGAWRTSPAGFSRRASTSTR